MAKKRVLKDRPKQGVLFQGIDQEDPVPATPQIIPLDFESHAVRVVIIAGEPWWVLVDVCRILEIEQPHHVASRLKEDERNKISRKDVHGTPRDLTTGSSQVREDLWVVNEKGLYRVIFRSDKPEAERFQDWVFGDVLPAIRKTGSYSLPVHKRVAKEQRRLKCDHETAVLRVEQFKANREGNERLCAEGVSHGDWYNARYLGAYGKTAQELREMLELPKRQTPLDRHSSELLAQDLHSKAIALRVIKERNVDPDKQPLVLKTISLQQMKADLAKFPRAIVGVVDGGKRGLVLDFICPPKVFEKIEDA